MAANLYWQVIPGLLAVVVHTENSPVDEEWDQMIRDISAAMNSKIRGVLIYADTSGPTTAQRARAGDVFKEGGLKLSIMSGSRLVRGIVTAFGWTVSGSLKVFSTRDFAGAIGHFDVGSEDEIKVRLVLKQLAHSAGVQVEAFADESGQFRRKYKS